jgi:hypothetical protein
LFGADIALLSCGHRFVVGSAGHSFIRKRQAACRCQPG